MSFSLPCSFVYWQRETSFEFVFWRTQQAKLIIKQLYFFASSLPYPFNVFSSSFFTQFFLSPPFLIPFKVLQGEVFGKQFRFTWLDIQSISLCFQTKRAREPQSDYEILKFSSFSSRIKVPLLLENFLFLQQGLHVSATYFPIKTCCNFHRQNRV